MSTTFDHRDRTRSGPRVNGLWKLRLCVIRALNVACMVIDEFAYRPAVVKATMWMPRYWRCDLARLSIIFDDRWKTGFWDDGGAPEGLCDVCHRRAAYLVVGGPWPDLDDEDGDDEVEEVERRYLDDHAVHLCGWCRPDFHSVEDEVTLQRALDAEARRSIAWRWRP